MFIKLSDIKPNPEAPTDKKFMELYKLILQGKLGYYNALIDIKGIKPFTTAYKPELKSSYVSYMLKKIQSQEPPRIHLYQDGEVFIMSDDFSTYYTYIELGVKEIPSVVMGEPTGKWVLRKDKIPNPKELTAVMIEEPERH